MRVTREQLYKEVWSEAVSSVAKRYDVSDTYLARVCRTLGVPIPPRGYWEQCRAGKADPPPALPAAKPGEPIEWARGHVAARAPLPVARAPRQQQRRSPLLGRHRLLLAVAEYFQDNAHPPTSEGYLRPRKNNLPDLIVTGKTLRRAIVAANAIYNEFEARGFTVDLGSRPLDFVRPAVTVARKPHYTRGLWEPGRPTIAACDGAAFGITLFEPSKQTEFRRTPYGYTDLAPTGLLTARLYAPYEGTNWEQEWTESRVGELEDFAAVIADTAEKNTALCLRFAREAQRRAIEAEKQAEIDRQRRDAERRAYQRKEREQRRVEARRESREELLKIIKGWDSARAAEAFFDDLERRAESLEPDEAAVVRERLNSARALVGDTDTVRRIRQWNPPPEPKRQDDD